MRLSFNRPAELLQPYAGTDTCYFVESAIALATPSYLHYYQNLTTRNSLTLTLVDNSAYLDKAVDFDTLMEIATQVRANVIIAPDRLGNRDETLEATEKFIQDLKRYEQAVGPRYWSVMGVAQGNDILEKFLCAQALVKMGCTWIGVSHILGERSDSMSDEGRAWLRLSLVRGLIKMLPAEIHLHILGIATCWEIPLLSRYQSVTSCDSAYAYLCATRQVFLPARKPHARTTWQDLKSISPDWNEKCDRAFRHNIDWMKAFQS